MLAERKDEPFPESIMRLVWKFKEARDEEQHRRDEWVEHLNSTYSPAKEDEVTTASAFRPAERVIALHERDQLGEAHDDTPKLARAYLDAIQERKGAMSSLKRSISLVP
jgi:hypothetical protein